MTSEIASEVTPGHFSLDDLLLGDAVLDNDALDELDGSGGLEGEDFFKLSAQEWQNRTLLPLKEDLAIWISELIGVYITPDDFFERLSSGVILCQLARYISEQEVQWKGASSATPFKAPINTRSGPFFSRENLTNFLRWCRALHINDTCLFESSDLVLQRQLKNVIVCLYAIARRFKSLPNLKLPALIQLEDELDSLENESVADSAYSSNEVHSEHSFYSGFNSISSQTDEPDYDDPHGFSKSVSVMTSQMTLEPLEVMTSSTMTSENSEVMMSPMTSENLEVNRRYDTSNRTPVSSRGSRIPRYAPKNPKDSSLKPSRSYGCLSSATSSENLFSTNRARKSSIPILATNFGAKTAKTPTANSLTNKSNSMKDINKINHKISNNTNNNSSKPQTKTPAARSKSLDMRKRAVLKPTTNINIDKQRKTSVEERKKHEPRSKFCKTGCTPQKRCCLKQEEEPKKRKPREEDYVIMDLDEESASNYAHSKCEKPRSKFHYKIRRIIRKCKCEERMIVKKLAEGTYLINDKKVYVRILNRKHVMVRVGGGWQTFEEYLIRHDPQRISVFARDGVAMLDNTARPTSDKGFLVASSIYKSPSLNNQ